MESALYSPNKQNKTSAGKVEWNEEFDLIMRNHDYNGESGVKLRINHELPTAI